MKLVQKTILATAIAVAFSPAAFADVTLSGKAAAEIAASSNYNGNEDASGLHNESDGLEFKLDGKYDIVGGNTAGFVIKTKLGGKTWKSGALTHDQSYVFVGTGFGKFSIGRQTTPTDDLTNDYWGNSAVAGVEDDYFAYVDAGKYSDTTKYTNNFGPVDFGFSISADKSAVAANKSAPLIADGGDFIYDVAATVDLDMVKLKAGLAYTPKDDVIAAVKDPSTGVVTKVKGEKEATTNFILGADLENFTATVTSTNENKNIAVLVGGKYAFTDVVTGKATVSALTFEGKDDKGKKETKANIKVAVGADYHLADNVVAHTVADFKKPSGKNAKGKDKEVEIDVAAGLTVKF